jgi:glyoxylase-like metal-dependent hydrolase (beta-lactamase superfamily II)
MEVKYFFPKTSRFKLDGGAMFGIIPKPLWSKVFCPDELNRIDLTMRLWLIQTKNKIILVDTGIGDYHDEKFHKRFAVEVTKEPIKNALLEFGFNPDQITDLVLSHLHFDHAGGLLENSVFPFKKAKLHLHHDHWNYSLAPTPRDTGSFESQFFKPVIESLIKENRVIFHQGSAGTILTDLDYTLNFKTSMGHTPHLMHPYDDKYIYMADLIPTKAHVPVPWVMGYDISPGQTTLDKMEFEKLISEKKLKMIFEHDPDYDVF